MALRTTDLVPESGSGFKLTMVVQREMRMPWAEAHVNERDPLELLPSGSSSPFQ